MMVLVFFIAVDFADWTWEEFKKHRLGAAQNCSATAKGNHKLTNVVLPESVYPYLHSRQLESWITDILFEQAGEWTLQEFWPKWFWFSLTDFYSSVLSRHNWPMFSAKVYVPVYYAYNFPILCHGSKIWICYFLYLFLFESKTNFLLDVLPLSIPHFIGNLGWTANLFVQAWATMEHSNFTAYKWSNETMIFI